MPISPALETAIGLKIEMLDEQINKIYAKVNTLKRLIDDDIHIDDAILAIDAGFDLNAMYADIVVRCQNYIQTEAQYIADNI